MCEEIIGQDDYRPKEDIKALFAEDFVNHLLVHFKLPELSSGIENRRNLMYNAFNQTVKTATDLLYRRLLKAIWGEFDEIIVQGPLNRDAFMNYARFVRLQCYSTGSSGFNARKLLHFCVKISAMGATFYSHDVNEGPALAVQCILNLLEDYDMTATQWDNVNSVANDYTLCYAPDSVSPQDSGTESELPSSWESDTSNAACTADVSVVETDKDNSKNEGEEKTLDSALELQPPNILEEKHSEASCSRLSEPPGSSKASCLLNSHAQASSEDDAVQMTGSAEYRPISFSDEVYESEVFQESVNIKRSDPFERLSAKKPLLGSMSCQLSHTSVTCSAASATEKDSNMSPSETDSDSSTRTSKVQESPIGKGVPKTQNK